MIIITNNKNVEKHFLNVCEIIYINGTYKDVLLNARDKIHKGYELLTHPLSGSIKPNETPFKSLAISSHTQNIDFNSLTLIEDAIYTYDKFMKNSYDKNIEKYSESILQDFMEIDLTLISSAIKLN